jgi:hypothetical protein
LDPSSLTTDQVELASQTLTSSPGCPAGQQVQPAAHLERPGGLGVLVLHEDGRAGHRVDTLAGMFDVTRLRVLAAVARYGSITAVADSPL